MTQHIVAIGLKIPDNEAYTALAALQRLGIAIERVERAVIWVFESDCAQADLLAAIKHNEMLFNPNKHELTVLEAARPRRGEVWVQELGEPPTLRVLLGGKRIPGVTSAERFTGWRLFEDPDRPATPSIARAAADRLLCNPAIERFLL